jgi:CheY-like chemotaxis protein
MVEHGPRLDRTALVVDDDVFVVAALAELLEEDGFDVHTASNGFSALRQVAELHPAVMLLDLALPERSGADLLDDLRADPALRHMAIVVVTGHADGLSESQIAETDGVISKPFDDTELLLMVHRAVQRAATRRAEVAPVAAVSHLAEGARARRASSSRSTRGRR